MKKTLVTLFTVVLAVFMCVSSFAITLDSAETADTAIAAEDASLAAAIVPGINTINGKAAVETFEELTEVPSTMSFGSLSGPAISTEKAHSGTKAIKGVASGTYPKYYFVGHEGELNRKYFITASIIETTGQTDLIWWIMEDGASDNSVYTSVGAFKGNSLAGDWTTLAETFTAKASTAFWFQMKGKPGTFYMDDVAVVPYYKIEYVGAGTEYVLFADEAEKDLSKLMTSYTVKTDNYPEDQIIGGVFSKCIGWATTEGATEPITSVALANADVKLYPVWSAGDFITTENSYMLGKKGTTFTITANEAVEWTYDTGVSTATVETTETTLTITANGLAGEVAYTAKAIADETKTVSAVIRLIGGDYYLPGYNLWTGTEEAYGFEDVDNSIIKANNGGILTRDKEIVTVGAMSFAKKAKCDNAENMAVYYSGNFPHFTSTYGTFPAVEAERPVFVSYNKMGVKGASLLVIRNALNSADGKIRLRTDGLPEYESDWLRYYTTVKGTDLAVSNIASDVYKDDTQDLNNIVFMKASGPMDVWVDDIMVVPYYKITYCDADGVPLTEDYALVDGNGEFLEYYVPDNSKVSGATGFALEMGGERVSKVALNHSDITLYAIKDNITTYAYGENLVTVDVEGDTFTFPEASEVFEGGVSYFKAWYVAGKNYFPGDVVEASAVIGKFIEAVAFKDALYDPNKGVLVMYADYEQIGAGENTIAYVNNNYSAKVTGLDGINGMSHRAVTNLDGDKVLKVHTTQSTGQWGKFRFGSYTTKIQEDAKYSIQVNVKSAEPKYSGTDAVPMASRYAGGFIRFQHESAHDPGISNLTTSWANVRHEYSAAYLSSAGLNVYAGTYTSNNGTPDDTTDDVTRFYLTDFYFDDFAVYCYPKNLVVYKAKGTDAKFFEDRASDIEGTYTFPTPEALGMDVAYFAAWTDGENFYEAGEEVAFADIQFKNFYAYVEDPTTPAMGFAFEGQSTGDVVKASYSETMIDDGRTVAHIHQWGTTWDSRGMYVTDTRTHIKHSGFDASVYNIVEYAAKVENAFEALSNKVPAEMTADDYAPVDETEVRIFYYTNKGDTGVNFWGDGGEHLVGNNYFVVPTGEYVVSTFDMGIKANGNATYPWVSPIDGTIYGLVVDPNKSGNFAGDIYIDYLRVYKGGRTTVSYDTNAPVGTTVLAEVPADTGRGVGTGYLLTGKRPAVEGYIFKGWALTADATAADVVEAIDLAGDTTLYAVWESAEAAKAPATTDEYSIRGNSESNGLRFKATIKNSEMSGLEEFGFIATRKALLGDNELTFALKQNGANVNNYVSGVAYDKSEGINIINGEEADGSVIYTAVATGIPMDKKNEELVMRTYAKYTINNMHFVVYGGTMNASLYNVALEIKNAGGAAYENNKAYIDSILAE